MLKLYYHLYMYSMHLTCISLYVGGFCKRKQQGTVGTHTNKYDEQWRVCEWIKHLYPPI